MSNELLKEVSSLFVIICCYCFCTYYLKHIRTFFLSLLSHFSIFAKIMKFFYKIIFKKCYLVDY